MPGVGKSTLGILLAKASQRAFVDTDVAVQTRSGRCLQDIVDQDGPEYLRRLEEQAIVALNCVNTVIATGGSTVYSEPAMHHLGADGWIVHLYLPLDLLRPRLADFQARGVVRQRDQSIDSLFAERLPLYRRFAETTVDCSFKTHEQVVVEIGDQLRRYGDLP
ncbi:MAG: shikimate kinase [Deltaproteobacteria bacterium]|nr:shikimate kinase [Deltaproteobacteria bacterium]